MVLRLIAWRTIGDRTHAVEHATFHARVTRHFCRPCGGGRACGALEKGRIETASKATQGGSWPLPTVPVNRVDVKPQARQRTHFGPRVECTLQKAVMP